MNPIYEVTQKLHQYAFEYNKDASDGELIIMELNSENSRERAIINVECNSIAFDITGTFILCNNQPSMDISEFLSRFHEILKSKEE